MVQKLSYCGQIVKRFDPDRFFLSLFTPGDCRQAVWTLIALNHEIAKTREVVSETQLGLIRLQWWREEIGKIYDTRIAPENEILQALLKCIQKHDLPQDVFEALIYGREFDLEGVMPTTLDGTLKYIELTNVPLMQLIERVINIEGDAHLAVNYGIVGLIRALPFHARQERCYLPENFLREHGVNEYTLYKGREVEKIIPIVQELTKCMKDIKVDQKFLKAINTWTNIYAKHLQKYNFDIFKMTNAPPPKFKELRCFVGALL